MGQIIISAACCCVECACCSSGTYSSTMYAHMELINSTGADTPGTGCCDNWNNVFPGNLCTSGLKMEPSPLGVQGEDCLWTTIDIPGDCGPACGGRLDLELSCGPDVSGLFIQAGFYESINRTGSQVLVADFTIDLSGLGNDAQYDCTDDNNSFQMAIDGILTYTANPRMCDYSGIDFFINDNINP